jgi:ABC-2 type transport system ATP-binding protein
MSSIHIEELVRGYEGKPAVRGLNLEVAKGELYGLVGPDGAGKTTTISCLAGLMAPDSGSVRVLDRDPIHQGAEVREHLGLMPQEYSLYGDLTIAENLRFYGKLFSLPKRVFLERRDRLLAITRLAPFADRRASDLSGGMYKKLALSAALLHRPEVLLLDEPTNGVDPVSRRELWDLIYELVADGMAVLVSTPYMDEAARCHRVGLMHHGGLIAEGAPGALIDELEFAVCEIEGGEREALHKVLAELPEVVAASPAGAQLRVVLAPGSRERVADALSPHGARLRGISASFEDLFLARVSEAA